MSKMSDSLRLGQLMASLANEGSPYRSFGFGAYSKSCFHVCESDVFLLILLLLFI